MNHQATRAEAEQFLFGRIDYERTRSPAHKFTLDRMESLLEALGNPQYDVPAVHIAGSKGKGSTAAMVSDCLRQAGYRVGTYTSPHLHCVEERIAIDGKPCSEGTFVDLVGRIRPIVDAIDQKDGPSNGPTYFEIITAVGLLAFAEAGLDIAVIEVGLGGRLDSTNLCRPCVSVITSISLDHTKQLGETLGQIAREKAGIIKPGVPVICGVEQDEPLQAIQDIALEQEASLFKLGQHFGFRPPSKPEFSQIETMEFWQSEPTPWQLDDLALSLPGTHQMANASSCLAVMGLLRDQGWTLPDDALRRALASVHCPARIETIRSRPHLIVDSAHNVASIQALVDYLTRRPRGASRRLIFATSRDKDARAMLQLLLPCFDEIMITQFQSNPRFWPARELADLAIDLGCPEDRLAADDDAEQAWRQATCRAEPDDLICATGSFFLAAEVRPLMLAWQPEDKPGPIQSSP